MIIVTYQRPDMEREAEKEFNSIEEAHAFAQGVAEEDGWAEIGADE